MNIVHEALMNKLEKLNNADDVYKIAEAFLGKRYFFKFPLISKNEESFMTNDEIIMNFIKSCDSFSIEDINEFADKAHLSKPSNYLQLIIDLSNDFVQISTDSMINKEKMSLAQNQIEQIKNELSFYINSFGKINTIKYKGYDSLPDIGYKWNKYLLAGIVRSYLSDFFKINYLGNTYKTVEFEISLL